MLTYNGIVVLKYNCCIEVQMHCYRSTIYHLSLMQMNCEDKARFLCGTPALYGNPTLSRHRLGCYCGMFHLQHTNGTYCNNIYTGEIQTSNYLRILSKMEFLCYNNDKYYMKYVTKKSKGNVSAAIKY